MKVTGEMLRLALACQSQVDTFEAEWADGVEVNIDSIRRAEELGLDTYWFATNLLTGKALAAYLAADTAAWKVYKEATAAYRTAWEDVLLATEKARWRLRFASAETRAEDAEWQAYIKAERVFTEAITPEMEAYYAAGTVALADAVEE